jgi:hypothetical protein
MNLTNEEIRILNLKPRRIMTTAPDLAPLTAKTVKLILSLDSLKLIITGTLLYNPLFHHFYIANGPFVSISFKPKDVNQIATGPMPVITLQTKTR